MDVEKLKKEVAKKLIIIIEKPAWDMCQGLLDAGLIDPTKQSVSELARIIVEAIASNLEYNYLAGGKYETN